MLHASAVALEGRCLVILGPSGAGKSALALQLMALGARLVADDMVLVSGGGQGPLARAPGGAPGLIEARGLGLLSAETEPACVVAAVDLAAVETERLPPRRTMILAGHAIPLLHKIDGPHFAAALLQYLRSGGRAE